MTNFRITAFFLFVMRIFFCLILLAGLNLNSFSQTIPDTTFLKASLSNGIKLYEAYIHGQELFYNGSAYIEPQRTNDQHAFFLSENLLNGAITFEGHYFEGLLLQYDLTSDQLITESITSSPQALPSWKLESFYIEKNYFEKIDNRQVNNSLPRSGFYQVLYNGKSKVLALREKDIQKKIEFPNLQIYFEEKNYYFILRKNHYYPVKGKASMLKLFHDQKSKLKTFIKKNHINFKAGREKALTDVSRYYDTLLTNN